MMDELRAIAQAKRGDADAFAFLVQTYETSVYRLALRMCGNAHDAEEVAQEAFVAAWRGLPTFRGEPRQVELEDDIDAFAEAVWSSLNADNKISLFLRWTDLETGEMEQRIINKHQ